MAYSKGEGFGITQDSGGRFSGLPKLLKQLDTFAADVQHKAMRNAMNAGMRQLKKDAVRFAPKHTGRLRAAIRVKREAFKSGVLRARMYVNYKGKKGAPHAHLVELGTKTRRVAKTYWLQGRRGYVLLEEGTSLGRSKADPFMAKAFAKNKHGIMREFEQGLKRSLLRAAKKAGR